MRVDFFVVVPADPGGPVDPSRLTIASMLSSEHGLWGLFLTCLASYVEGDVHGRLAGEVRRPFGARYSRPCRPIRSRSLLDLQRRDDEPQSMATGWCRARIFRHSSSISYFAVVDVVVAVDDLLRDGDDPDGPAPRRPDARRL